MLSSLNSNDSVVELTDGVHPLHDSKSDLAFCDPFKGTFLFETTAVTVHDTAVTCDSFVI